MSSSNAIQSPSTTLPSPGPRGSSSESYQYTKQNGEAGEVEKEMGTKTSSDDLLKEALVALITYTTKKEATKNGSKLTLAVAAIAIVTSVGSFVYKSGAWVGGQDSNVIRLEAEIGERKKLQERFDKLRDLYLVQFGRDPETVDLDKRQEPRQEPKKGR